MKSASYRVALSLLLALTLVLPVLADRTKLEPGWNLFSKEQDIEMGRQVAREAEAELDILNNRRATNYINSLGKRLASVAPGSEGFPFQFKIVNDQAINAFALPGGFIYINRGVIEAANNEAQLASVMAHEIAHVNLRHGTNQASKAYIAQMPLAILGGAIGSDSIGSVIARLGIGFAANSVLLKYSRDAERQADILGTQILYDAGLHPQAMAQFFEILEERNGGSVEFFSSHPNPENRIGNVNQEIRNLGGPPRNARWDSAEFRAVRQEVSRAAAPRRGSNGGARNNDTAGTPDRPARGTERFQNAWVRLDYPENWEAHGQGDAATLAPAGGIVEQALAYGMIVSPFEPEWPARGRLTVEEATGQLIETLRRANPSMRIAGSQRQRRIDGHPGLVTLLTNTSPFGGSETDILFTVMLPDGNCFYFVGVAPQAEYSDYEPTFHRIIDSVRFR